jgi:predicted ATPase
LALDKRTAGGAQSAVRGNSMIGREEAVAAPVSRLSRERLVTIIGLRHRQDHGRPAVAERMIAEHEHGVWLVDLRRSETHACATTVATVPAQVRGEDQPPARSPASEISVCFPLDNCEHVIEEAASLATAVLRSARRQHPRPA